MMRKRAVNGTAAALLAVAALGSPAAAAPVAEQTPDECPVGAVCFWTEPGFEGEMTVRENPGFGCDPVPHGKLGSIVNHLNRPVGLFADTACEEFVEVAAPFEPLEYVESVSGWR